MGHRCTLALQIINLNFASTASAPRVARTAGSSSIHTGPLAPPVGIFSNYIAYFTTEGKKTWCARVAVANEVMWPQDEAFSIVTAALIFSGQSLSWAILMKKVLYRQCWPYQGCAKNWEVMGLNPTASYVVWALCWVSLRHTKA